MISGTVSYVFKYETGYSLLYKAVRSYTCMVLQVQYGSNVVPFRPGPIGLGPRALLPPHPDLESP